MRVKEKELYEFVAFRLDVAERSLVRLSGQRVQLSEKAFETLCVLVRNSGHLVRKDELLNQVWADSFVEENNLDKCIHAIRRALDEKPGEQKIIETVRKHGYRFVAEVRRLEETRTPDEATHIPANREPLPLEDVIASEGKQHEPASSQPEETIGHAATVPLAAARPGFSTKSTLRVVLIAGLVLSAIGVGYYLVNARKTASGASGRKTIAVLPLRPIDTAKRDEIYEIGIADSLILKLSLMKAFLVRPLSATRKYADIAQDPIAAGKEQKVEYVLALNYQLVGGKIGVTAQLCDVTNGQCDGIYKREKDASDVFAMQDAIADEVGNILLARFATTSSSPRARRGTNNEEAYRLYLQGRNLTGTRIADDIRKAVEYFEQAIKLDPNFARAYSGMAHAFITSGNIGADLPRVEYEKAKQAVTKALELDNNLAEGYAVLGELKFIYEWDYAGAEKDLLHAIALEPNSDLAHQQYAFYLAVRGRFDEAIAESKAALEINPNALIIQREYGVILYLARRYDEAILQFQRIIEVYKDLGAVEAWLWQACEMKGDNAQAYEWFMKLQKRANPERVELYQNAYEASGWQGVRQKKFELDKLDERKPGSNLYRLARQCALLRDKEHAFEYLNKAIEKRHGQLIMLNVEPPFDILRDDPRFDELVRRVGLK
jgi:DNA-binding winged helix-turn-helix (wHTH) protein/Tfp pilus assembly protein PilF/TolB-like protein